MSSINYESYRKAIVIRGYHLNFLPRVSDSDVQVSNTFLTRVKKLELSVMEKEWIKKAINCCDA